jgi:hypothetical protein
VSVHSITEATSAGAAAKILTELVSQAGLVELFAVGIDDSGAACFVLTESSDGMRAMGAVHALALRLDWMIDFEVGD